jgi:hypothetical protein
MALKKVSLSSRKMYHGYDYSKDKDFRMTGKEWHQYAKCDDFKCEIGGDTAFGNRLEIYLDGTDRFHKRH